VQLGGRAATGNRDKPSARSMYEDSNAGPFPMRKLNSGRAQRLPGRDSATPCLLSRGAPLPTGP
jgi:hypothetical protein